MQVTQVGRKSASALGGLGPFRRMRRWFRPTWGNKQNRLPKKYQGKFNAAGII